MKLLTLMLIPFTLLGSAPKKYTIAQLKDLKPPLLAQQHTLHHKITAKVVARIAPHVAKTMPFSPRPARRVMAKGHNRRVPFNSPVGQPVVALPVPEFVLNFEAVR
jgi:hypothetical protein